MTQKTKKVKINHSVPVYETWYTMSKAAKLIGKMGRNKVYEFLRNKGILMRHNEPYQTYCDKGYFKLKQVPKYNKRGQLFKHFPVLLVSTRGIKFIIKLIEGRNAESDSD